MTNTFESVSEAAGYLGSKLGRVPPLAIVLGSGLGEFANRLEHAVEIPYGDIPNWPGSSVAGHQGVLASGSISGRHVVALSGRAHFYEGHLLSAVVFPVRVLWLCGVRTLILTNAAGGINTGFARGALMIIDDHMNLMGTNPLIGPNDERFGPRFPDMSEVYSRRLRIVADEAAAEQAIPVVHGVYAAVHGPSYETPAEIRALRGLGADAVGMSTVPEAIAARHAGMEVLGISCITNMAAGVLPGPLDHADVIEAARRVRGSFIALLEAIVRRL
ncbi:MAG: purine-nucleoside phosphorylase [Vicinamibacterales bacterium]